MSRKQSFPKARLWIAALLLAGLLVPARALAPTAVVLLDSIKPVEQAAQTGPVNPHKPFISRSLLHADESAAPLEFEVVLKMRNFSELQARVARGERISPQEMAARYDPLATDYQAVAAWITSRGLTITRQDGHHMALFASGKISQIQQALKVTFARVTLEGKEYTSAITAPSVPMTLSPILLGINGLQPHLHAHRHLIKRQDHPDAAGGTASYLPKQIAQAYNATGLYNTDISGSGQTIAIVIDTFPATGDLIAFWKAAGVSQSISNIQFVQAVAGQLPQPSGEETLDTEWSSSIAPGAHVRVYAATDFANADLDQAYLKVYDDVTNYPGLGIHQMSMSYGEGETDTTGSQMDTDDQYFVKLATAGVTVFASSGDGGSTPDNLGGESGALQVETPASDPNVTGVGGTTLVLNGSNNETSEVVWNNSIGASGGGISGHFSRPVWQTGTGVPGGNRAVPDVACSADPNYGAMIVQGGIRQTVGGTSWSSPTWAAFCALINQARSNAGQASLGVLGPHIYPLLNSPDYSATYLANFRDITGGNNATGGSGGKYAATAGYDACTGLGVPLMQPLTELQTGSSTLVGVQMPSPVQSISPGQYATFTVTVGGSSATYQWQRMPVGSSTWSTLGDNDTYSGSATATMTVNNVTTAMSGDQFQCLVTLDSSVVTTAPPSVLIVETPLVVSTLAGQVGTTGIANGTGTAAQFNYPSAIALDTSGNLYIADFGNNQIRKVTPEGAVSTPFGSLSGTAGSTNSTGNNALFNSPNAIAADSSNNLYVADTGNNIIRKIIGASVSTLAGTSNHFNGPEGIAVDGSGNVYVADTGNNTIREISPSGTVSILAGQTGVAGYADGAATTQALFNGPTSVAVDSLGNVYVADFNNCVIRKISSGTVTTVAGQAGQAGYLDGLGPNALFNAPIGLAVDSSNNLYITDSLVPYPDTSTGNNLVRELTPAGVVSTIAGQAGVTGSANGTGAGAQFYSLQAVAINSSGQVYLADTYNQTIRVATFAGAPVIANATVTLGNLAATYSGTPQSATATTTPPGLSVTFTYNGSTTAPTAPGSYTVIATVSDPDYQGSATGTLVISKAAATVTLGNLAVTYDAAAQSATATTSPPGLTVNFTYNGSATTPTTAGSYAVVGTVNDPNYQGSATGTFVIGKSTAATITLTPASLTATYSGTAQPVTATTSPSGLTVDFTYNGKTTVPTAAGTYTVVGTISNADYAGSATGSLVINPATATVTLTPASLAAVYNGKAHAAAATTSPTGLSVTFTYNSSATAPILVNSYTVVGTVSNVDYVGSATGTLTISAIPPLAVTSTAAAITDSSATLSGTSNPEGSATTVSFQYGLTTSYTNTTTGQSAGSGTASVPFSTGIRGLAPQKIYHYRAVASHGGAPVYGADKTFTTLAAPVFVGNPAAYLAATGAEVGLSVNPGGVATTIYFEYSTSSNFSTFSTTAVQSIGSGKVLVNLYALFPNLLAGQLYYYQAVISSAAVGTNFPGPSGSFTTLPFDTALVAQKGGGAPDVSGGTFASFGNPAVNTQDGVAFAGTLTTGAGGVTTGNDLGVWADDNTGTLTLIAQSGSGAAPGTTANFLTFSDPVYNDHEALAFRGTLKVATGQATSTTATGVWATTGSPDSLALVARQGGAAPGANGGTFDAFTSLGLIDADDAVAVLYATLNTSTAAGVTTANNAGIWEGSAPGNLALLLRLGQTVGSKTITKLAFLPVETTVNGQTRGFNTTSGDIVCGATFSDKTTGIVTVVGGTASLAEVSGGPATGGATFASFGNPTINTSDDLAFEATLTTGAGGVTTGNDLGLWTDTAGTLALIAQSGGAAPGTTPPANFLTFSDPVYNNNGAVAFRATLKVASGQATSTTATGVWATNGSPGSLALVAQQGVTPAPGCPAGATFSGFTELALADQGGATDTGGVMMLATLNTSSTAGVTTANNLGIWAVDTTGALRLIARTGDTLNGKTVTGLAFLPAETTVNGQGRSFAQASGDLVYLATFSDKSTAIFNVVFP